MKAPAHRAIVAGLSFTVASASLSNQAAFGLSLDDAILSLPESFLPFGIGFVSGAALVGAACAIAIKMEDKQLDIEYAADLADSDTLDATSHIDAAMAKADPAINYSVTDEIVPEVSELKVPSPSAGIASTTSDLVDVAKDYVERQTLSSRLKTQARGVAAVLAERLGGDRFDDLPVIQRADGTVGDVGTSWWNNKMGDQVLRVGSFEHDGNTAEQAALNTSATQLVSTPTQRPLSQQRYVGTPMGNTSAIRLNESLPSFSGVEQKPHMQGNIDASKAQEKVEAKSDIPSPVSIYGTGAMALSTGAWKAQTQLSAPPMSGQQSPRSRQMLGRKSELDAIGSIKERDKEELEADDLWTRAMGAMDDKIKNQTPNFFEDNIGSVDTIDEIEGLEGKTTFIPFRTPAGHPEVVDTESYVDYLIGEEFNQNSSKSVRKTSRDYLRVIEGGSIAQNTRRLMRAARAAEAKSKASSKHSSHVLQTADLSYTARHLKQDGSALDVAKEA